MEILFENTYKVTKTEYKRWAGVNIWKYPFTYVWIVLMGASFVFIGMPFLFATIELFCIYRAFIRLKFIQAKRFHYMALHQGKDEWERVLHFGEQIIATEGNASATYDWGNKIKIKEVRGYQLITIREGLEIVVKNDGFTKGTLEEFKEYIRQRNIHPNPPLVPVEGEDND